MSLTVTTVNVNGIRAATRERHAQNKGFLAWLENASSDVVCLQEVRATEKQATTALAPALDQGWHLVMQEAQAKGRAGVAILSRQQPDTVRYGLPGTEFEDAGRYIEVDFSAVDLPDDALSSSLSSSTGQQGESTPQQPRLSISSLYLPSGEVDTPRQDEKYRFMQIFREYLMDRAQALEEGAAPNTIVCGDWNIAHRKEDLKNYRGNYGTSGFLPQEREWMSSIFGSTGCGQDEDGRPTGWTDAQRYLHPDQVGPYSWWSYRGKAFDNNAGWRIDYQAITSGLVPLVQKAIVERAAAYDLRWSDHAPVTVTYA